LKATKVVSNSIINLVTQIIPIFVALIFIPISIELLGNELFGVYSLVVTFIVLFNYLNFGIAPATTKELAKYLAQKNSKKIISLLINSFLMMLFIGLILAGFFLLLHNQVATYMFDENINLKETFSQLLRLLGFLSPFLMLVIFLRSVLEAKQLFLITSLNRAFLNSIIFISPTLIYIENFTIISVFKFLIIIYIISTIILSFFTYKEYFKNKSLSFSISDSKALMQIGFWMMLSSLAGIGLYYADRFIIGTVISATAVAYYVASYDLVTRLNIISGSLTSALFPAFSHWFEIQEQEKIKDAVIFVSKIISFIVASISFLLIVYAEELLTFWINEEYSQHSYLLLQYLTIGVFFNTLSVVPFRTLSAIGFQKSVAIVYIIEAPLTVTMLYYLISDYGLIGAVVGYNIRAFIEVVILYLLLIHKNIGLSFNVNLKHLLKFILFVVFVFVTGFYIADLTNAIFKILLGVITLFSTLIIFYSQIISSSEKEKILEYKQKIIGKLL